MRLSGTRSRTHARPGERNFLKEVLRRKFEDEIK